MSLWDDRGDGRIVHRRIERYHDGADSASVLSLSEWTRRDGTVLLVERRRTAVQVLPDDEWWLVIDPSTFHVRDGGWMGASLTFDGPRVLEPGQTLRLRYGVYVHAGVPSHERLERQWRNFAATELPSLDSR